MAMITDSLTGATVALGGTPVESSDVTVIDWQANVGTITRSTDGARVTTVTDARAYFRTVDVPLDMPAVFKLEAEIYTAGGSAGRYSQLSAYAYGVLSGTNVYGGVRLFQQLNQCVYSIYAAGTGPNSTTTVYTDNTVYSDYVKRRIEVDTVNLTFACYANDTLLHSGSFSANFTVGPDGIFENTVDLAIGRESGTSATSTRTRNLSVMVGDAAPPAPSEFWTAMRGVTEAI